MYKAIFLDRDGTINEEMGYINHLSRFKPFDYSFKAIKILNEAGYKVFIVTNQSGIARGYFKESLLNEVHKVLMNKANKEKAKIEKIYYCPHHVDGIVKKFKVECDCRKPKPGMLLQAKRDFDISLNDSYLIGDRYKDIQFGQSNGLKTILVMTGYGLGEYKYQKASWKIEPDFVCENLLVAAQVISQNELRVNN